jgi:hypothetical protein
MEYIHIDHLLRIAIHDRDKLTDFLEQNPKKVWYHDEDIGYPRRALDLYDLSK